MLIYFYSYLSMFLIGGLVFSLNRKHLLLMLLSLEFIVLSLFFMIIIYLNMYISELYFSMIYITMSVCEGVLGLSILVSMIRSHGNDYFNTFNLLW